MLSEEATDGAQSLEELLFSADDANRSDAHWLSEICADLVSIEEGVSCGIVWCSEQGLETLAEVKEADALGQLVHAMSLKPGKADLVLKRLKLASGGEDMADSAKTDISTFLRDALALQHAEMPPPDTTPKQGMEDVSSTNSNVLSLVATVRDGTDSEKEAATKTLGRLAVNDVEIKAAIARAGGIEPLVTLARDGNDAQKEHAAGALTSLARLESNKLTIANAGGIEALVALASGGTEGQKEEAAAGLCNLAGLVTNKAAIARAGGIRPLVALVRNGTAQQKLKAMGALGMLASNSPDTRRAIARAAAVDPLVELLRSGSEEHKEMAAKALRKIARS